MAKRSRVILIIIIVLASVLRFYRLGSSPPSLSWDEASIGYNAYSLAQTLRDEHGRFLPYDYFSAFGDYKPPVSIYLTAISVKLFGLSIWSVRMPFAFLGVLTVLLTFFLAEEFRRVFKVNTLTTYYSLLAAFMLTISPWHTLLSRQAFEANMATFFIVLGALFLLKGLDRSRYFMPGIISLVVSVYTFNSPRLFVPLFILAFVIIFHKQIRLKSFIMSILVGGLIFLPILPHLLSPLGQLRFKEVNIFSDAKVVEKANSRQTLDGNTLISKVIHNRRVGYFLLFMSHYMDHFNIDYLFFNGDVNPKFSTRSAGQFFLIEALFLTAGCYFLWKKETKIAVFVFSWLLIGLIPAALARETPHALRTEVSLPAWQLVSAAGLFNLIGLYKKYWRYLLLVFISVLLLFEFSLYLHNYYVHYPRDYSQDWQYGYKLAAEEIKPYQNQYQNIMVSDKYGRPYIFFLTYGQYDPVLFQKKQKTTIDPFGFYHVLGFAQFKFGKLNIADIKGKTLLIYPPDEMPVNAQKIKDIYYLNGEKALVIAQI